ncbi:MAG: hypothetical protein NVS3B20_11500 [Polyangiales bacterium]
MTEEAKEGLANVSLPSGVLAIRRGPGANCSSIGSIVDLLFGAAVLSSAIYAGILASLADAPIEQVGLMRRVDPPRGHREPKGNAP